MSRYPNTSGGDVQAWSLTPLQAAQYHGRLSQYHTDRAVRLARQARRHADQAERFAWVALACFSVSLLLFVLRTWAS